MQRRALALWVAAAVVLAACGADVTGTPMAHRSMPVEPTESWRPIDVPGVASCRVLTELRPSSPAPVEDGLRPVRLPCLTDGDSVDLSELRGRPLVVNLWATWCGQCRKEMPMLQAASVKYAGAVQFVGVDTRDGPPAGDFLKEIGVTYPQLADVNGTLLKQLRSPGLPVTVVVDADGSIAAKRIGALDARQLDTMVERVRQPSSSG